MHTNTAHGGYADSGLPVNSGNAEDMVSYLAAYEAKNNGCMLYMLLVSRQIGRVWSLSAKSIVKRTTLSQNDLENAFQELGKHGYWTPGKIDLDGKNSA